MSYQESSQLQQYLEQLEQLRLHSATPSPETTPIKPHNCRECGTLKRKAPSASLDEEQPSPKVPNHQGPINLPQLQRCLSAPTYSQEEQQIPSSENGSGSVSSSVELGQILVNSLSPENSKTPTTSSSLSTLLRSISDPTVATTSSQPPTLPKQRAPPLSPVSEETANSRRLRRMRKRMKEMRKWVGEAIKEQDEEDHVIEDVNTYQNSKMEGEHQEAVWIEKKGDGLALHFKCPCGEGYAILLCDNNCYYKLM